MQKMQRGQDNKKPSNMHRMCEVHKLSKQIHVHRETGIRMSTCGKYCLHKERPYLPKAKSDVHLTPDEVYEWIEQLYGYSKDDLYDPCPVNYKYNALQLVQKKVNYVNPPYTLLKEFVADAIHQAKDYENITIMLLPAKTDQEWFHDIIAGEYRITWIQGRLKFKNDKWHSGQSHFLVLIK